MLGSTRIRHFCSPQHSACWRIKIKEGRKEGDGQVKKGKNRIERDRRMSSVKWMKLIERTTGRSMQCTAMQFLRQID